jgi:hypothetical protein
MPELQGADFAEIFRYRAVDGPGFCGYVCALLSQRIAQRGAGFSFRGVVFVSDYFNPAFFAYRGLGN